MLLNDRESTITNIYRLRQAWQRRSLFLFCPRYSVRLKQNITKTCLQWPHYYSRRE